VPLALSLGSVLALSLVVGRGWVPTDEGVLAHSAERVLHGELPHRDFDDVYTGGLAMFDAGVFRLLGARLFALRVPLVAAFGLWTLAVYAVAKRFTTTAGAALVTLLAAVWTVPCYPAAMPSWYTLFLFTAGTAALCVYIERRQPIWLVLAGLAGGVAITIKVIGLYYVAAAFLLFVFLEQQNPLIVTVLLAAFVAALVSLVRHQTGAGPILHYVVPSAALAGVLLVLGWSTPTDVPWTTRLARLMAMIGPFLAGVALPIAVFLVPYVMSGALRSLVSGTLISPQQRFQFAALPPASLRTIEWGLPWVLLLAIPAWRWRAYWTAGLAVLLAAALVPIVTYGGEGYHALWRIFDHLDWTVVLVGAILVALPTTRRRVPPARLAQLWLLLCMSALCCLVRFPYAGSYYILYFAPLAVLAIVAIVSTRPGGAGAMPTLIAAFLVVVGVACTAARRFNPLGIPNRPMSSLVALDDAHGGLLVPAPDRAAYTQAIALIDAHTPPGGYTYSGPDNPLIYFLADRRDPVRTLYDFFDTDSMHDKAVLGAIDAHHVTTVAINTAETFSPPMDSALRAALRARFPDSAVASPFVVRWRDLRLTDRAAPSCGDPPDRQTGHRPRSPCSPAASRRSAGSRPSADRPRATETD
jgi:hypothetical protein